MFRKGMFWRMFGEGMFGLWGKNVLKIVWEKMFGVESFGECFGEECLEEECFLEVNFILY
jgi:hypothetical protein